MIKMILKEKKIIIVILLMQLTVNLALIILRDNMKYSKNEMVQRGHHFSIVDEIDSCLIDEARTPLVISGAAEDKTNQYLAIDKLVKILKKKIMKLMKKIKIFS